MWEAYEISKMTDHWKYTSGLLGKAEARDKQRRLPTKRREVKNRIRTEPEDMNKDSMKETEWAAASETGKYSALDSKWRMVPRAVRGCRGTSGTCSGPLTSRIRLQEPQFSQQPCWLLPLLSHTLYGAMTATCGHLKGIAGKNGRTIKWSSYPTASSSQV